MKFQLFKKSNTPKHKKDGRINPHRFWMLFTSVFIIVVIIEIIFFTYFFINTSKKIDAPVEPKVDNNARQIEKIEKLIQKTEEAVSTREGVVDQQSPQ